MKSTAIKKQKKINILNLNIRASWSLSKLLNCAFWQSIFGPIFAFIFPIFFILIYMLIMKSQADITSGGATYIKSAMIGMVALQVMQFSINSIPTSINDYKNSVLLKRIGSTPIKPITFLMTCSLYYGIIMIVQLFWCLALVALWAVIIGIDPNSIFGSIDVIPINWGGFIFSSFYMIVVSIFISLFVVSVCKSPIASNAVGMIIFFLSMFLSGMLFPIQFIANSSVLNVLSYFTPFRYTTGLLTMSWNGCNIFDLSSNYTLNGVVIYHVYDQWLNFFMPVFFVAASIFVSAKNFKWNAR